MMFDFGPTTVSGAALTNSPYHSLGGSTSDNTWNKVQLADVGSGLLFSDNSAATGVTFNLGVSSTTTIGLGTQPSNSSGLGGATPLPGGIYESPSVGRDGIFAPSTTTRFVGFQLGGLSPGTYDIYISSRNTNTSAAHSQFGYVGKSAAAGDFDVSTYSTGLALIPVIPTGEDGGQSAWAQDVNYTKYTLTLAAGEFLNIAANGGNGIPGAEGSEARGFLNSVQIMAVPEPSAALLSSLAMGLLVIRRRRSV